jgi:hypothetical protein
MTRQLSVRCGHKKGEPVAQLASSLATLVLLRRYSNSSLLCREAAEAGQAAARTHRAGQSARDRGQ